MGLHKYYVYAGLLGSFILVVVIAYAIGQGQNSGDSTTSNSRDASLIADCAKQAQVVLEDERINIDITTMGVSQTNHYNRTLNKCLVNLVTNMISGKAVIFTSEVRDAYEQKSYLTCTSGSSLKSFCFIPGNQTSSGQAESVAYEVGMTAIRGYMSN